MSVAGAPADNLWVCPDCGASNTSLTPDFCPACGWGGAGWLDPPSTTTRKKKKGKKVLVEEIPPSTSLPRSADPEAGPTSPNQAIGQFQPTRQHAIPHHRSTSPTTKAPIPGTSRRDGPGSESSKSEPLKVKWKQPGGNMRDDEEGEKFGRGELSSRDSESRVPSLLPPAFSAQDENSSEEIDLTLDHEKRGNFPKNVLQTIANELWARVDETSDTHSHAGSDIDSIFSDGGVSASSASTASLNPVQTTGIHEVSRALLSQEDLKALYITAVRNIERRKARAHIRGFLREYGRNLLKEASNSGLEIQAAKFVQELAGRIADEIGWSINGFQEVSRSLEETRLAKKDLESWLLSLKPQNTGGKEEPKPSVIAETEEMFEDVNSDEEIDSGLLFPNIDKVKDFLLNSEAFGTHVAAMRTWLKVDGGHDRDVEKQKPGISEILEKPSGSMSVRTDTAKATGGIPADSAVSEPSQQETEHSDQPSTEVKRDSEQDTA